MEQPGKDAVHEYGLAALDRAVERFHTDERTELWQAFASTAEALYWTAVCDESFRGRSGDAYASARSSDPDGRMLEAAQWARHRVTHPATALVVMPPPAAPRAFAGAPFGGFLVVDRIRWAPVTTLPEGEDTFPSSKRARPLYSEHLDGHPVSEAIDASQRWLRRAAREGW